MRQLIFLLLLMGSAGSSYGRQGFTVKTRISNPGQYTLTLSYSAKDKIIIDSNHAVENGWLVFKGKVDEPVIARLFTRNNPATMISIGGGFIPGPYLEFILTNETIEIEGEADTIYVASVNGGKANKEWRQIKQKENDMVKAEWIMTKSAMEGGTAAQPSNQAAMQQLFAENRKKKKELHDHFIATNPNSMVSIYLLSGLLNELDYNALKTAYDQLGSQYKNTAIARRISEKIEGLQASAIGNMAVPINKKDIHGNPVTLASLKGKYVLIDFWGSWCGPCRKGHPHLKDLYAKYKEKGFEIVGIAYEHGRTLEENKQFWKTAIEQDGINWIQVLNNEDADKFDAVKAYGVSAFPTKILLDKEGRVIGRYIGEDEKMDKKLAELIK